MVTKVLALPFAGAGASVYRSWGLQDTEHGIEVRGVQLPGREELFTEPWPLSMDRTIDLVVERCEDMLEAGDEVAFFGHSFGAILAFEAARAFVGAGRPVRHLFASGSSSPRHELRRERAADLSDEEFVAHVEQIAGYRHEALAIPELREVILPVLRADVDLHEGYRAPDDAVLPVPVTALRGVDDHVVSAQDAGEWSFVTTAGAQVVELRGGHMYLVDDPTAVLQAITTALDGE